MSFRTLLNGRRQPCVTASVGVQTSGEGDRKMLIADADTARYAAKS
jgi:GGDEF domain-containing protein